MARPREASKGASSLVFISKTEFTAVSSVSINNCFSSTYDNYKVLLDTTAFSSSCNVNFKFRTSGSDLTNTYYGGWTGTNHVGTAITWAMNNAAAVKIGEEVSLSKRAGFYDLTLNGPYLTSTKNATWNTMCVHTATSTGLGGSGAVSYDTTGSASDGITFLVSSGTFTGNIRIYGIRN
jgi:hypothetical protein